MISITLIKISRIVTFMRFENWKAWYFLFQRFIFLDVLTKDIRNKNVGRIPSSRKLIEEISVMQFPSMTYC